jgi:hypothetical protein
MEYPEVSAEKLKEIKAYALSNQDIQHILEPDTKILSYPEFCEMDSIDEAFDLLGRCIFLFLTESPTSGHWLAMIKKKGYIIYFDPYGDRPEEQRKWISEEQLYALGESEPCLMNLLKQSGYKVYSNTVDYQKEKKDYNTCGRWCVARLILKDLDDKQFFNLIKQEMKKYNLQSPDDWVSLFTYSLLGK